ncbi:MAG TPA: AAA family ATPase [Chloroflexota bacterium]
MPIIAVANQKGGVGKTTSTLNLGAALQEAGKRVLLVDLDPQGNLSVAAGIVDIDAAYPSIGDLLAQAARGRTSSAPGVESAVVHSTSGMHIVPANATLSAAELGLVSALNRESMLASLLKSVEHRYDYILIDCLPSLGLLAINALRAANGIVIPVQADFLAMQGLAQIFETIAAVREQLNPDLNIYGVLLTLVDQRTGHSREVVKVVRSSLAGQVNVFETEVRLHVALKETARAGRTILDYDSKSPSAQAYRRLAIEVLTTCGDVAGVTALAAQADAEEESGANLLDLPFLVAATPESEREIVAVRPTRADAPRFESFVMEDWQRWLGSSW